MSHGFTEFDKLASAGLDVDVWHQNLTGERTIKVEDGTVLDAMMELAGVTEPVEKAPVYIQLPDGTYREMPYYQATYRVMDGLPIDICSPDYQIIQPAVPVAFVKELLKNPQVVGETCGTLHGYARAWLLARLDEDILIAGMESERMRPYLLMTWSHAPKRQAGGLRSKLVEERVVCRNTWDLAFGERRFSDYLISTHRGDVTANVDEARTIMGFALSAHKQAQDVAERLIQQTYTEGQLEQFVSSLFPITNTGNEKRDKEREIKAVNERYTYLGYLVGEPNLSEIKTNAWGLVQAATGYDVHVRRFGSDTARFENAFGLRQQANTGLRATGLALKMAGLGDQVTEDIRAAMAAAESD